MDKFSVTEESVHGLVIEALLTNSADVSTCQLVISAFALGETRRVPCRPNVTGSIVRVRAAGSEKGYLSLCEVQVYGVYGRTVLMFSQLHKQCHRHTIVTSIQFQ